MRPPSCSWKWKLPREKSIFLGGKIKIQNKMPHASSCFSKKKLPGKQTINFSWPNDNVDCQIKWIKSKSDQCLPMPSMNLEYRASMNSASGNSLRYNLSNPVITFTSVSWARYNAVLLSETIIKIYFEDTRSTRKIRPFGLFSFSFKA